MNHRLRKLSRDFSPACIRSLSAYVVLISALVTLWIWLLYGVDMASATIAKDLLVAAGAFIGVTLPYWWMGPRWRAICMWLVIVPALFILPNLWYYRFWGSILSPVAITMTENVGTELWRSTLPMLRWSDIAIPIIGLLPGFAAWLLRPLSWHPTRWAYLRLCIISGVALLGSSALVLRTYMIDRNRTWTLPHLVESASDMLSVSPDNLRVYLFKGPLFFTWDYIGGALNMLTWSAMDLTPMQREEIARFIISHRIINPHPSHTDTVNMHKNLVIIVVESLNADVVGRRENGVEITPVLNRLIHEPGTFSCARLATQTRDGNSIDGQLLINTGMLPISQGVSVNRAYSSVAHLPSLPKIFDSHDNAVVFATDGQFWHERQVNIDLGYSRSYVLSEYEPLVEKAGRDGGMFLKAEQLIREGLRRPFLLQLVTGSMHTPFDEPAATPLDLPDVKSPATRAYLTATHYFDRQLGLFIDFLKEQHLYDDTMIVIASDHTHDIDPNADAISDRRSFVAMVNCGITGISTRTGGQVNIFPTILQATGVGQSGHGYSGLGESLLSPMLRSAVDGRGTPIDSPSRRQYEAWQVADLIWLGNYFGSHPD